MTRKLYWKNPYEKEFTAKVISIRSKGIILDQTLFYPHGGNQLGDQGLIRINDNEFNIRNVTKEGNEIIHHISSDFRNKVKVGDKIIGQIDWTRRYGLMKSHSSQHIFSAVIKNKYDIDTVRAILNYEDVSLSISQVLSYEQLKSALQEINEICTIKNQEIHGKIIPNEEIEQFKGIIRGNFPSESQIRIVEIKNLDMVCCGGTHVQNSTEIGPIFIYDFKKGKEIKYYIGDSALNTLTNINVDLLDISNSLNVPIKRVKEKNEKNNQLIATLRDKNKVLTLKTLELIAQNPIDRINDVSIFFLDLEIDHKTISKNLHQFPSEALLIIKLLPKKYKFISKTQTVNANSILQGFLKLYGGKGGGNPSSAQGTFDAEPKDILSDLRETSIKK